MALLEINRDECIGCGDCVEVCPFGSLSLDDEDIAVVDETCTACGACLPECPVDALSLPVSEPGEADLSDYQGVWFWVEQFRGQASSVSWEMAGKGRELADELGATLTACVLGRDVEHIAGEAICYGADRVFLVDDPTLGVYRTDPYAAVLVDLVQKHKPEVFILGASTRGRDLAGSVATQLRTGLTADCTEGVRYRRGSVSEIYKRGDKVAVRAEDTLLGEPMEMEADLVVLATGIVPRSSAQGIAELLKLPRSPDGFFAEAHPKLRPVDTVNDGIYLAGCCQGPKDIPDTIAQAKAAASSAMIPLSRGKVRVESVTGVVEVDLCAGCGICESFCTYGALARDDRRGIMSVNEVLCKGCGACAAACPSGTMTLSHFTHDQIMAQIEAMLEVGG